MKSGVQNSSSLSVPCNLKPPFDDPSTLNIIRAEYFGVQLGVLAVQYIISLQIKKKNDQTVLKYVEPAGPMRTDDPKLVTTTVGTMTLQKHRKEYLRSVYTGVAMMGVMHIYFHFTQPLFIHALICLKNLYDAKVVQIYLMGKPANGNLKRPFKTQGMFGPATGPHTDAAAIAEAEKKIDKKDD